MRENDAWLETRKAWFDPVFIDFIHERIGAYQPSAEMTRYDPEAEPST